jgi:hypothetical protein
MRKTLSAILLIAFVGVVLGFGQAKHPSELRYPQLTYEPPDPKAFKTEYANGLRAYVQEDHSLPLFNITALINFGGLYVPQEKTGLDRVLSDMLIRGGTKTRDGAAIEERVDFLGGSLNFMVGERTSQLSLSVLSKDLDEGLAIFFDVLMNPEFREDPLKLAKARLVEQLRQANDQPSAVLNREYEKLLYGDNALTWQATKPLRRDFGGDSAPATPISFQNIILAVSVISPTSKPRSTNLPAGRTDPRHPVPAEEFPGAETGVYSRRRSTRLYQPGPPGPRGHEPRPFRRPGQNFILGGGTTADRPGPLG